MRFSGADADGLLEDITRHNRQRLEKEALQVRDYAATRRFLRDAFPQRGRLLEIGCGLGYLLEQLRSDGWATIGIEPNEAFCRYASTEHHLDVIPDFLDSAGITDEFFDVVLMMHVIEHVPSPVAMMSEIFRVLKPGGVLVMETPRYDTLSYRLLGRRERSLSCDGHIYFFTTDSLRRLAALTGFDVVREDYVGRSLTADRLLYNVGVISKSKKLQQWLSSVARGTRLNRVRFTLNIRDMERLYLRKPELSGQAP